MTDSSTKLDAPRSGHYRFYKSKNRRSHFAIVGVTVSVSGSGNRIEDATKYASRPNEYESVDAKTEPEWIQGAVEGVEQAFALLAEQNVATFPLHVRIDEVSGAIVDTVPSAVGIAATMAVLNALHLDDSARVIYEKQDGPFVVVLESDAASASRRD